MNGVSFDRIEAAEFEAGEALRLLDEQAAEVWHSLDADHQQALKNPPVRSRVRSALVKAGLVLADGFSLTPWGVLVVHIGSQAEAATPAEVVRCGPCLCVESGRPTAPGVPDPACSACAGSGFASLDPEPGWHSDGAPLTPLVLTLTDEQSATLAAAFDSEETGGSR